MYPIHLTVNIVIAVIFIWSSPTLVSGQDVELYSTTEVNNPPDIHKIFKCCSVSEAYDVNRKCVPYPGSFTLPFSGVVEDVYETVIGRNCEHGSFRVDPNEFVLHSNGTLSVAHMDELHLPGSYCLENFASQSGTFNLFAIVCFPASTVTSIVGEQDEGSGNLEDGGYSPNSDARGPMLSSISKCCNMSQSFSLERKCEPNSAPFTPPFAGDEPQTVDIILGLNCEYGSFRLNPDEDGADEFQLLPNGSLYLPNMEVVDRLVLPGSYCLENFTKENGSDILALLCFPSPGGIEWKKTAMTMYSIGCLVSVPFLAATTILFTWAVPLRDLRGLVLGTYTGCLTIAFAILAYVQTMGTDLPHAACVIVAFIIQCSFLASFFWLNVLCFHTWWKVRLSDGLTATTVSMEDKRYKYYSLYAWSIPIVIVCLSMGLDLNPTIPATAYKPNFGVNSCWFHTDAAAAIYFYGPIAVVLAVNLIFFCLIARILFRNETRSGLTTNEMKRLVWVTIRTRRVQTFKQCVMLFCLMGLNWMLELISWVVGGPTFAWLLTDIINTLQGPIIFYLFVWRDADARRHFVRMFLECKWKQGNLPRESPPLPGSLAAGLSPGDKELKPLNSREGGGDEAATSFAGAVFQVMGTTATSKPAV